MYKTAQNFDELVSLKYQLYNGLFLSLPFEGVQQTGIMLPLLQQECIRGLANQETPVRIIDNFISEHTDFEDEKSVVDFLFRIIQYVERQVVLVDALEDAAYTEIRPRKGVNSFTNLARKAKRQGENLFSENLLQKFGIRVVLTAHPTQFYPSSVLGVITDLTEALKNNQNNEVRDLLYQLGKTPFLQREKPDPFEEAVRLSWYLEQIFYPAISQMVDEVYGLSENQLLDLKNLVKVGFWPGGDRDGNPFVTPETTSKVAEKLRSSVIYMYRQDLRMLKRRLSFSGVYESLQDLELALKKEHIAAGTGISLQRLKAEIMDIHQKLINDHQGLFAHKCLSFYRKLEIFGYHFASLDIRQDSRKIAQTFEAVCREHSDICPEYDANSSYEQQITALSKPKSEINIETFTEDIIYDTLASMQLMRRIQENNGEDGCNRYIISNCRGAIDVMRVWNLMQFAGWGTHMKVDIVPLFETVNDLKNAAESMRNLYQIDSYRKHLERRGNEQTIMLGFSDGTKDGGYLMANWSIYKAKKEISQVSEKFGMQVVFFDGRGGPPARGGGNAYSFYSDLGKHIHSRQIQMTVQGQTISSHYGTVDAALHNMELLIMAGLQNTLRKSKPESGLNENQSQLLEDLAQAGYICYQELKSHPQFLSYLENRSTLHYYGKANIGSRPSSRNQSEELKFGDLRAIPFVGAWSQLKQNVPGFYGVGTALAKQKEAGNFEACKMLYKNSLFFKALIDNSMQSMSKTNFELTQYMSKDEIYGEFWNKLFAEFQLSRKLVLELTEQTILLPDNPVSRKSIALREQIVLPLLVIQQYALIKITNLKETGTDKLVSDYEKVVIRSLFGNINAGRNSA